MNVSQLKINIVQLASFLFGKEIIIKFLHRKYINLYKNNPIIFVHIPKVAGTSITKELYGKRNGHLTAAQIKNGIGGIEFIKKTRISMIRNPYDRLVSAYFYAVQGGTKEGGIKNPKKYKSKAFDSFETFITEWLIFQNLHKVELIFRPQYLFLYENDRCLVDFVGKIEKIEEFNNYLKKHIDENIEIKHSNRSNRSNDFMNYYNQKTKKIVQKLYQLDFDLFDYNT